jgi:hypothetical protein
LPARSSPEKNIFPSLDFSTPYPPQHRGLKSFREGSFHPLKCAIILRKILPPNELMPPLKKIFLIGIDNKNSFDFFIVAVKKWPFHFPCLSGRRSFLSLQNIME